MGRNTTKTVALTPETKNLIDDRKPEGVTYDYFVRHAVQTMDPLEGRR